MQLKDIQLIFNRSIEYAFDRTKWLLTFAVLALSGVFVVFCRGLATHANPWMTLSLTFLPIFICAGILLAFGIVLIRAYHDQVKKKKVDYRAIFSKSWDEMLGAAYFTVPFMLIYLTLWMLLGLFLLLQSIPLIGDFFGVILAFAPFLLNFSTLLLALIVVATLFFVTPIIALKGLNRTLISKMLIQRFQTDLFYNLLLFSIGLLPIAIYMGFLTLSAYLTGSICLSCQNTLQTTLQWFFLMIPFTALLAPAVIFFFNFAAESHVLSVKKFQLEAK